jgi:hypothetical protein
MLISDLIKILQDKKEEHGDLWVEITRPGKWDYYEDSIEKKDIIIGYWDETGIPCLNETDDKYLLIGKIIN